VQRLLDVLCHLYSQCMRAVGCLYLSSCTSLAERCYGPLPSKSMGIGKNCPILAGPNKAPTSYDQASPEGGLGPLPQRTCMHVGNRCDHGSIVQLAPINAALPDSKLSLEQRLEPAGLGCLNCRVCACIRVSHPHSGSHKILFVGLLSRH